jgi:hypothetical protein
MQIDAVIPDTVLLTMLGIVVIALTLLAATLAAKTIRHSTAAGLTALGIMLVGMTLVLFDSFVIIDTTNRNGREVFVKLAAAQHKQNEPCECHSTRSGNGVTTTCSPPGCSSHRY